MKNWKLWLLALSLSLVSFVPLKAQRQVLGGFNIYYGSLHNHTNISDGLGTPAQAYNYARNTAHLDFFGLSDHSYMISSSEWSATKSAANSYNADGVFATFYGFEWTTLWSYGHVSVFNTEDFYSATTPFTSFNNLLTWVNSRDAVAFFNHPGWDELATSEFDLFTDTPSAKFVGMELWNDQSGFSTYYYNDGFYANDGMKGYFDEALIRGWKIGAAGADDNHNANWGTATNFRVGVLANNLTRSDLMAAFKARRFFSTLDNNLALSFTINGAPMGSTIQGGTWDIEIMAADGDGELFDEVKLIKNGEVVGTWTPWAIQPVIREKVTCSDRDYLYVKVRQATGDEAISSPIFISGTANLPPTVILTSPVNGATFELGASILLTADASDADGITKVEFYQGTTLLGEDSSSPYTFVWNGATPGTYGLQAKAYDTKEASAVSPIVTISVVSSATMVDLAVTSGADDAEESKKGSVILNSDDIDLVYDNKTTGNQYVGLRFQGLNIPQGAAITKAFLQFTSLYAGSGSCSLTIAGHKTANAPTFTTKTRDISLRPRTLVQVSWLPPVWNQADITYQTPDISSIVQEIVNQSDWSALNSLAFIITGTGTRTAYSFEKVNLKAAKLHIEYSTLKKAEIASYRMPQNRDIQQNITLYPNPVTEKLNIRITDDIIAERILIYTMTGTLVNDLRVEPNDRTIELDCRELDSGLYLLRIQSNRGSQTVKFIRK